MATASLFKSLFRLAKIGLLAVILFWVVTFVAGFWLAPVSTLMWARYLTFRVVDQRFLPLSEISPNLIRAVAMSEDGQYCQHGGVDWEALKSAVAGDGKATRGASTLTMQVTKNMMLWPGRSYIHKALEIPLSLSLDKGWGKQRTLQTYLNIAEWGDGIFGAEAAARYAFNKSARNLSVHEAALLASSLPNPFLRNPKHPSRHQLGVANVIQARMTDADYWLDCIH